MCELESAGGLESTTIGGDLDGERLGAAYGMSLFLCARADLSLLLVEVMKPSDLSLCTPSKAKLDKQ